MCQTFKLKVRTGKRFSQAYNELNEKPPKKKEKKKKKRIKKIEKREVDQDLQGADTDILLSSDSDKANTNVSDDKDDEYFPPYTLTKLIRFME